MLPAVALAYDYGGGGGVDDALLAVVVVVEMFVVPVAF